MLQFKVYFAHGEPVVLEAVSGQAARDAGARVASANRTVVLKVKRVRS